MGQPSQPETDLDLVFVFRLRAGPADFAEALHARARRAVREAIEESLDVRGQPRGWADVGPLRPEREAGQ